MSPKIDNNQNTLTIARSGICKSPITRINIVSTIFVFLIQSGGNCAKTSVTVV